MINNRGGSRDIKRSNGVKTVMSRPASDVSDSRSSKSEDKPIQELLRSRRDKHDYTSYNSSTDTDDETESIRKQRRRRQYAGESCSRSQLDSDTKHCPPRRRRDNVVSSRTTAKRLKDKYGSSSIENIKPSSMSRRSSSRARMSMQCKRDYRRDPCSESDEAQQQQFCARQRRKHRGPASSLSDEGTRYGKKSGGYMKPEKFIGTSCFETFLVQFDNCAKFNCWSETDKLQYLRWSLTGTAAQMLWGTEDMSFQQLVAKLRS